MSLPRFGALAHSLRLLVVTGALVACGPSGARIVRPGTDADEGTGGMAGEEQPPDNTGGTSGIGGGGSGGGGSGGGGSGGGGSSGSAGTGDVGGSGATGGESGTGGTNDLRDAALPPDTAPPRDAAPPMDQASPRDLVGPDLPGPDTASASTLATGLVGRWKFDEGSGTKASDDTDSSNDGTFSGGVTWSKTVFPGAAFTNAAAVHFDGVDGVMDLATFKNFPAIDGKKSLSAWINFSALPATGGRPVVGLGDSKTSGGSRLKLGLKGGQIAVWKGDGTIMVGVNAVTGAWHHVVYTFDGNLHHLYVDGQEKASGTTASDAGAITQGHIGSFGTEHFSGDLDDLRLYNRVVTAAEVTALHAGQE
jgi:hypothetical protein